MTSLLTCARDLNFRITAISKRRTATAFVPSVCECQCLTTKATFFFKKRNHSSEISDKLIKAHKL